MARKKAPIPDRLPLDQQPLFLKTLEYLPKEDDALVQLAGDMLALFNDAMRCSVRSEVETAHLRYQAVVYRLNGDTFFGCRSDGGALTRLQQAQAAAPGTMPLWGQIGEWLIEVDGVRVRVESQPRCLDGVVTLGFHAVDPLAPFFSETGYRAHFLHPDQWLGHEFSAAVRQELEWMLQSKEGRLRPINDKDRGRVQIPAWLAPALEGVTRNGQLAMPLPGVRSAVPAEPEPQPKAPLSNAERQRLFRQRQKEKRLEAEAEGRRTLTLNDVDLARIWIAFDTHMTFKDLLDWDLEGYLETAGRLFAHQPAAYLDQLGTSQGVVNLQKQRDKRAELGWEAYKELSARHRKVREALNASEREVNAAQREVQELKAGLQELAELVGGQAQAPKPPSEVEQLRRRVESLEALNATEVADRARAFAVVETLQARLQRAGLPHDYRRLPGE